MKPLGIQPAMFVGVDLDDQCRPVSLDASSGSLTHQELGPFDVDLDECGLKLCFSVNVSRSIVSTSTGDWGKEPPNPSRPGMDK